MVKQSSAEIQIPKVDVSLKPPWVRIPDAVRLYGIGRTMLYDLISQGKIRSASIRKRDSLRGLRIISTLSLEAYCESLATGGEAAPSTEEVQTVHP